MFKKFWVAAVVFVFAGVGMATAAHAAVVTGTAAAAYNGDGMATYSWRIDTRLADIVLFQAPQEGPDYENEYRFSQSGSITYPVDETTRCWEIWTGWDSGDLADREKLGSGCLDLSTPTPDADGDGVGDTIDSCPDTAADARVDEAGCSVQQQDGTSFERETLVKRCVDSRVVAYAEYEYVGPDGPDGYQSFVAMYLDADFYSVLSSTNGSVGTASYEVPLGETVTVTLVDTDARDSGMDFVRDILTVTGAACDDGNEPTWTEVDVPATPDIIDDPTIQDDARYALPDDDAIFAWTLNGDGSATVNIIAEYTRFIDGTTSYSYPAPVDVYNPPSPPKGTKASCPKGKPVWVDANADGWIQPKECKKA